MKCCPTYSVLMSVYRKERPEYLRVALDSMIGQTVKPSEIVMVKDGWLTEDLDEVLSEYDARYPELFRFVSYEENRGLGFALREGVLACSHEIIARMDTDDYSYPNRMEVQLRAIYDDGYDMVGSQVSEFVDDLNNPVAITNLPEDPEEIRSYSKRRNPFRHPPMTFRKNRVIEAGNYSPDFLYFEDWDLFNRMLDIGCRAHNIHETLVAMRVSSDFYSRRGGLPYLRYAWDFKRAQFQRGYFTVSDLILSFVPQAVVCLLPNSARGFVYLRLLRRMAS